jgi:hypothetical protein
VPSSYLKSAAASITSSTFGAKHMAGKCAFNQFHPRSSLICTSAIWMDDGDPDAGGEKKSLGS